ncbi:MAG: hypothetical protein ABSA34_03675 [Candidatus Goldiibacteriota bacterium]
MENKIYSVQKNIELSGIIENRYFNNVKPGGGRIINGKPDRITYWALVLNKPINVLEHPSGGPENNVGVLQLAPDSVESANLIEQNINRQAVIKGELCYRSSSLYYEKVILSCNEVKIKQ